MKVETMDKTQPDILKQTNKNHEKEFYNVTLNFLHDRLLNCTNDNRLKLFGANQKVNTKTKMIRDALRDDRKPTVVRKKHILKYMKSLMLNKY